MSKAYCLMRNKKVFYEERPWQQPIIKNKGFLGGKHFACEASSSAPGYNDKSAGSEGAFDGDMETYWRSDSNSGWVVFYNPSPIKVSSLVWYSFYSYPIRGSVLGSNNNIEWVKLSDFTNPNVGVIDNAIINIDVNSNECYKYYKVQIDEIDRDVMHCKSLVINATERVSVENETALTESIPTYYGIARNIVERHYYKELQWVQPTMTSNSMSTPDGVITVSASNTYTQATQPYKLMLNHLYTGKVNNVENWWFMNASSQPNWIKVVFPYKLKISKITVCSRAGDNAYGDVQAFADSNMSLPFGCVVTTNRVAAEYTLCENSDIITDTVYLHINRHDGWYGLQNLQITATRIFDATEDDYDFYTEEISPYGFVRE